MGKSHSNMPKATFSVLIRLFCQIHHFPRNSSAPLPNPQRFLPNHWLIANFCKFIIFCTKKSHLPAISFTYFALNCCFHHIGNFQGATHITLNFHLTLGSFVPNSSLSKGSLSRCYLNFCYHWWILTKPSHARVKFISFQGGFAWLITEFLQTLCQMHHFHQIRLFHHIFPRSLALAKLDHFAIFLIAPFSWRISKKHLDLMDQRSQQSLNPPWKIVAVWVQLLLSYLLHVDKFLIKHYQLNSRHKKDKLFPLVSPFVSITLHWV